MREREDSRDLLRQLNLWVPRVLIGISILLLVYFAHRTNKFSGLFDESFLAPENLALTRGPFAKKWYYERGEVDYQGKPLFEDEALAEPIDLSQFGISDEVTEPTPEVQTEN